MVKTRRGIREIGGGVEGSLWVVMVIVVVDQASKLVFRSRNLAVLNTGGVLGWKLGEEWWLIGVMMMVAVGMISGREQAETRWIWMVVMGAGMSNLMDRLVWGGVWDFIRYPGGVTGNLADVILVGAVGWLLWREGRKSG